MRLGADLVDEAAGVGALTLRVEEVGVADLGPAEAVDPLVLMLAGFLRVRDARNGRLALSVSSSTLTSGSSAESFAGSSGALVRSPEGSGRLLVWDDDRLEGFLLLARGTIGINRAQPVL